VRVARRGADVPVDEPAHRRHNGTGYNVYISMGITPRTSPPLQGPRESRRVGAQSSSARLAARDSGHFDSEIVGFEIPGAA
jgi:hypothetical protein